MAEQIGSLPALGTFIKVGNVRWHIGLEYIGLMELGEELNNFFLGRHIITKAGTGRFPYFP